MLMWRITEADGAAERAPARFPESMLLSGRPVADIASQMNVHHLELFFYVAQHGGISAAVRHIPYGIQQPAVSGQMRQLEEEVGTKLFERSPFRLTPAGERLIAHIKPFFENLKGLKAELRGDAEPAMRLGGAELVLREHLSIVMQRVRAVYPRMRLSLQAGDQTQVEEWLRNGQIDIAVTSVGSRPPARLRQMSFVRIPLVLLVHRSSPIKSAAELFAERKITMPLIGQPARTSFMQGFQRGLKRRRIVWHQTVEVTSAELVVRYVANREGCGVGNLGIPAVLQQHKEVRVLPLEGFEPLTMGALWRGEPTPLIRTTLEAIREYAQQTFASWAVTDPLPGTARPRGPATSGKRGQGSRKLSAT
jgi:DNA-binding transcriptional LysR family regulator